METWFYRTERTQKKKKKTNVRKTKRKNKTLMRTKVHGIGRECVCGRERGEKNEVNQINNDDETLFKKEIKSNLDKFLN